jgi:hypothetical protein
MQGNTGWNVEMSGFKSLKGHRLGLTLAWAQSLPQAKKGKVATEPN